MHNTMVTTTTYGTWLPGDLRGYVNDGQILPGDPRLLTFARQQLARKPVFLSHPEQMILKKTLAEATKEFGYWLSDACIDTWHLHWILAHHDEVTKMVGRLKTRMRQALTRGRIWTEGYCHRQLTTEHDIQTARRYIANHQGCWLIDGQRWPRSIWAQQQSSRNNQDNVPPGGAGG
ncbi:MAG: transposase [Phycisphaeraceae bacterium]|nr:transposase [Phycisphaeraceae bacterium]